MPLELKVNAEHCFLQTPMPSCVQGDISEAVDVGAAMASLEECAGLGKENIVIQQAYRKEIVVSRSQVISSSDKSSQSDLEEVDSKLEIQSRFSAVTVPRYLNLEPSLAMDWLEISWDELHIKERVGAGISSLFLESVLTCFITQPPVLVHMKSHFLILFRLIWDCASC